MRYLSICKKKEFEELLENHTPHVEFVQSLEKLREEEKMYYDTLAKLDRDPIITPYERERNRLSAKLVKWKNAIFQNEERLKELKTQSKDARSELNAQRKVDTANAITGLKAVQGRIVDIFRRKDQYKDELYRRIVKERRESNARK